MSIPATIMHFTICLPNWNSLESVRRAHSDLEGAALVFFALLVVCEALAHLSDDKKTERRFDKIGIVFFAIAVLAEIVAYPYGQRNDTLSEQVIRSLDATARDAADNSSTALSKSGAALNNSVEAETKSSDAIDRAGKAQDKVAAVDKRAGELDERVQQSEQKLEAQREINTELAIRAAQRHIMNPSLFNALKRFPHPEDIPIVFREKDGEALRFALSIETAINESGWAAAGIPRPVASADFADVGSHVYANKPLSTWKEAQDELNADSPTRPAYALAKAIGWDCDVRQDTSLHDNQFRVVVAEKSR